MKSLIQKHISFIISRLRADNRTAKVQKNIAGSFVVKGVSISISLILVPLTIGYVSSELYGIWLTLATIISWMSIFDLGFGNGLRNRVAECVALNDWKKAKSYVSTAYIYFALIFIPMSILLYFISGIINWCTILNVDLSYQDLLVKVMRIVVIAFSFTMIFKIQNTILAALQMTALSNAIEMLGQLLVLIMTFLLTISTEASLLYLACVISFCPIVVYILSSFWLYGYKFKSLCPSLRNTDKSLIKNVLNLGVKFFVMQISVIVVYQTINIIISHVAGPESVTEYNVIYKYLSIPLMVTTIIIEPLWSAFTDAYTLKDYGWMERAYQKLIKIYMLGFLTIILLVAISSVVFRIWLGDKVIIHNSFVIVCAIYILILMWNSMHSALINGLGKIKLMLYCTVITIVIDIPVAYSFGKIWGGEGVISAIILMTSMGVILNRIQVKRIINQTAMGIWDE